MSWAESPMWATSSCPAVRSFVHLGPLRLRWNMTTRYLQVWSQKIFFKKTCSGFWGFLCLFFFLFLSFRWREVLSWLLWFFLVCKSFFESKRKCHQKPSRKHNSCSFSSFPTICNGQPNLPFWKPFLDSQPFFVGFVLTCWENPRIFRGRKRRLFRGSELTESCQSHPGDEILPS